MHDEQKRESLSNWDDLRIFLAVAKAGSFSGAAKRLRTTQPTISRRIEGLERQLGVRLLDRLPSGVVLTTEGEAVLETAVSIESSLVETRRRVFGADQRLEGSVRISSSEGLTTLWLTPRLGTLRERHPAISVEFQCSLAPADVLNLESELSIQFYKPQAPDIVAAKLGYLHFVPWASPGYLESFGTPRRLEDLSQHRLLDHEYYHYGYTDFGEWLALLRKANRLAYRTNSSTSLLSATQNGVGIALFPTYFREFADNIVPLDVGLTTRSDIWLAYHRSVRHSARIRAVVEWIKSLFDHEAWPWFREEFHSPLVSTLAAGPQQGSSAIVAKQRLTGRAALTPLPHRDC